MFEVGALLIRVGTNFFPPHPQNFNACACDIAGSSAFSTSSSYCSMYGRQGVPVWWSSQCDAAQWSTLPWPQHFHLEWQVRTCILKVYSQQNMFCQIIFPFFKLFRWFWILHQQNPGSPSNIWLNLDVPPPLPPQAFSMPPYLKL